SPSVDAAKAELRQNALVRRDAMPAAVRAAAAEAIAARAFPIAIPDAAIVSGFVPLKSEINPLPLLRKLAAAGAQLALPVVSKRGEPLIMRRWRFGAPLSRGVWDLPEPGTETRRCRPSRPAGASARLRPQRPSARLRRRLLRPYARRSARQQADY